MSIKPKLRTFDLSMIMISLVIGFGIFRTPAIVANAVETENMFYLVWLIGGIISLCGALTFAEVGARYPVPGGFYQIFSHCYHPAYALMLNWVLLLTMAASFAGAALIGAEYIIPVILPEQADSEVFTQLTAIAMIAGLWVLNYMGIKTGSKTQNLLSVIKILLILGIILASFRSAETTVLTDVIPHSSGNHWLLAIAMGLIPVFYTFGGYHQTMNFGGDIQNPERNIPRSIFIGIGVIIVLYLAINIAYVKVLGFSGVQNSSLVAADVAEKTLGSYGSIFISLTIFFSVMGFLNATLMSTPRMYYAMAEDKMLPSVFKQVNPDTQVQEFSLAFYVIASLISLVIFKSFENILNYVMFIDSLALGTAAAAIFILRRRSDGTYSGFKVPLYPVIPILFIIFLLGVSLNILMNDTQNALPGLGLFLMGLPIYLGMKRINK